ncbi:hypothetical protein M8756_01160 [Lutimaribacter sp. EGI FJ00015]|uniref:Uncharacterized protein n=1 Tax=Lutimaribacter degradans TaxID=2945989 RepID=A0ACC5ZSY6_9RHOB|nr:hypothetical protein [Lutimaribacter sp. EGI FJ00013]MCM2561151.1 hypothetical protein [Lutimaribacter sp. EGI FJ00013]MCO0611900.1 hypothetical protein [Lutimaribacter sp. EGI FJ00015]MCO0634979.1 hypothetical protein [Lutimaribacter sp. EGI FJ00014]
MGIKRFFFSACAGLLAGCATSLPIAATPDIQMVFDAPPTQLYAAMPLACSGPGERVLRPRDDLIECRRLLPPEGAASAILRHDGTIDALPESVIRFESSPADTAGTLVKATAFVAVPQRDGRELHVIYPDTRVNRNIRNMLEQMGGTPLPR